MSFIEFLKYVSVWSILLPFITGIIMFRKLNYDSRIILLIVLGGIIPQVLGNLFRAEAFKNITYNLYTPFEFCCYAFLFRRKFILRRLNQLFKFSLLFFPSFPYYYYY